MNFIPGIGLGYLLLGQWKRFLLAFLGWIAFVGVGSVIGYAIDFIAFWFCASCDQAVVWQFLGFFIGVGFAAMFINIPSATKAVRNG